VVERAMGRPRPVALQIQGEAVVDVVTTAVPLIPEGPELFISFIPEKPS
jgi:hypothetical protein